MGNLSKKWDLFIFYIGMAYIDTLCKTQNWACERAGRMNYFTKLGASLILDVVDFIIGAGDLISPFDIPVLSVVGTVYDAIMIPVSIAMWGKYGLISLWELPVGTEVGNAIDGFIPTTTIAGLMAYKGD